MYLLIISLPLLGATIAGFGGRWLGCYGSSILSTTCVMFSAFLSILAFYEVGLGGSPCYLTLVTWIECGTLLLS